MVRVNNTFSTLRLPPSGVPQGGVLSPVLFNIYTAFADDVKLYQAVKAHDDCLQLQRSIDVVNRWSNKWALPLSLEKTTVLHLSSKNRQFPYVIEGTPIRKFCGLRPSVTRGSPLKRILPRAKHNFRLHFFTIRAGTDYFKLKKNRSFPHNVKAFKDMVERYLVP
ncbi:hypothetical protein COOONC_03099 [Cooperia oncophora]